MLASLGVKRFRRGARQGIHVPVGMILHAQNANMPSFESSDSRHVCACSGIVLPAFFPGDFGIFAFLDIFGRIHSEGFQTPIEKLLISVCSIKFCGSSNRISGIAAFLSEFQRIPKIHYYVNRN